MMQFDGITYDPEHDQARLSGQCLKVFNCMLDHQWHTLSELARAADGSEAGVSARVRDLRKERFGEHTVNRQRRGDPKRGLWEYQLIPKTVQIAATECMQHELAI